MTTRIRLGRLNATPLQGDEVTPPPHDFASLLCWRVDAEARSPLRALFGVAVHAPETLLGLRPWHDTRQGRLKQGTPWTIFELEKLLRMLLHQSPLAVEIIARADGPLPAEELLSAGLTSSIALAYGELVAPVERELKAALACQEVGQLSAARLRKALHRALSGALLAREQRFELEVSQAVAAWQSEQVSELWQILSHSDTLELAHLELAALELERLASRWLKQGGENSLPPRPTGYDELHRHLIAQRLKAGRSSRRTP